MATVFAPRCTVQMLEQRLGKYTSMAENILSVRPPIDCFFLRSIIMEIGLHILYPTREVLCCPASSRSAITNSRGHCY